MAKEQVMSGSDYADLYDYAPVGYLVLSKQNIIREINVTACQMFGYEKSALLNKTLTKFISPQSKKEFVTHKHQVLRSGKRQTCELVLRGSNGDSFWVEVSSVRFSDGILVSITDISRLKNMEREMALHSEMLRCVGDGVIATDGKGNIIYWNDSATRIYGWSKKEVLGRNIMRLNVPEVSCKKATEIMARLTSGEAWSGELPVQRKDGSVFIADITDTPIFNQQGELVCVVGVSRDVTERKNAEQIKDEFISLVSHELRTPLTVIKGALKLVMDEKISPEDSRLLLIEAMKSSDDLAEIVDNLVELSRFQSGRLRLGVKTTDIGQAVQKIVNTERARVTDHIIALTVPEDLPPAEADIVRLQHVMHNLIDNASKYSPPDTEIHVSVMRQDRHILFGVRDHGNGISTKDQSRLFKAFERLREKSSAQQGLGLGLLVCKRLVEAHGGKIWVESKTGHGSTFWFTFPVTR